MSKCDDIPRYDLIIHEGADFIRAIQFVVPDALTPIDKSNCTYVARMAESYDVLEDASVEIPVEEVDLSEGQIALNLPNTGTIDLTFHSGVWDLQETNTDTSIITTKLQGRVTVKPRVPRP